MGRSTSITSPKSPCARSARNLNQNVKLLRPIYEFKQLTMLFLTYLLKLIHSDFSENAIQINQKDFILFKQLRLIEIKTLRLCIKQQLPSYLITFIPFIGNIYIMQVESQHSNQQSSFSSNLSNSSHQRQHQQPQFESNFVSLHSNSHKRQVDNLFQTICEKNLKPKSWLQRAKSDKNMRIGARHDMNATPKAEMHNDQIQNNSKSYQDQIVLSNYKQLLRNHFQSQQEKDQNLHQLQKKFRIQEEQNMRIRHQNQQLKKEMLKISKKMTQKEEKAKDLDDNLKKLSRKYENLLKESEAKQVSMKAQMKRLRQQKASYENLINALKESIHILKGKKVKDLQQIWLQWKQIFELASLQQCKLSKKSTKY